MTTPVAVNGRLKVCGVHLCNQAGRDIQLRGMSTHGFQWYMQCLGDGALDVLAFDWHADVLRIAMYVQEGGYEKYPVQSTERVMRLIDAATARGIYAIVDWHIVDPGDPFINLDRAKRFFTDIAGRYQDNVNVIYEVANEPNGVSWSHIKAYHEKIIPVIRAHDPDAVILAGTPDWSGMQADERAVVADPLHFANVMYTFHFYAAEHGPAFLAMLDRVSAKLPMFISEFGTQLATGDGPNDFRRAQQYLDLAAAKKISWVNWNYSDDDLSGAAFRPGACSDGTLTDTAKLKPAGAWIRAQLLRSP